jgi:hypothetical protein
LRSSLPLHILESLATYYEKNCFVLNHSVNWPRVCRFLHATTGNNGNFDHCGNHKSITVAYTKETHSQEESAQERGLAIGRRVARQCRVAGADTIKRRQKSKDRGPKADGR